MKVGSVVSAIALTAGLAFVQVPAQAAFTTIPVSKPVRYTLPKPVHKPVQACIVGKKLVLGAACKGRK